jgi:hypothetical protein
MGMERTWVTMLRVLSQRVVLLVFLLVLLVALMAGALRELMRMSDVPLAADAMARGHLY